MRAEAGAAAEDLIATRVTRDELDLLALLRQSSLAALDYMDLARESFRNAVAVERLEARVRALEAENERLLEVLSDDLERCVLAGRG